MTDTLLCEDAYIDGKWIAGDARYPVKDPATGEILAHVADLGVTETEQAINAAATALPAWRHRLPAERAAFLMRWFDLMLEHQEALAHLLTREMGKPLHESRGEVCYGASFVQWFAEEGKRIYGDVIPSHQQDKRLFALKQPVGVVAAITPWNFPNAMITRKVAPALAAGCTVVVKPAEDTPLSALALARLAEKAGLPAGVLNVVTTSQPVPVGRVLTRSPLVRKLSFTGSTAVGKLLMRDSAETIKKISLELGGNAPFIVFEDADIDKAVAGAIASKYRNAGQTCVCANRILVHDPIYDQFAARLAEKVGELSVGSGLDGVDVGPLINEAAVEKVERLLAEAVGAGAEITVGGGRHELGGTFFRPTLLKNVTSDMTIAQAEIFGPVLPLYRFSTEAEALALANNTTAGLAAYFFANDISRIWRVAEALEYGMVGINTGMISTHLAPFGGVKQSGIGREGSKYGIEEFIEIKYVCLQLNH